MTKIKILVSTSLILAICVLPAAYASSKVLRCETILTGHHVLHGDADGLFVQFLDRSKNPKRLELLPEVPPVILQYLFNRSKFNDVELNSLQLRTRFLDVESWRILRERDIDLEVEPAEDIQVYMEFGNRPEVHLAVFTFDGTKPVIWQKEGLSLYGELGWEQIMAIHPEADVGSILSGEKTGWRAFMMIRNHTENVAQLFIGVDVPCEQMEHWNLVATERIKTSIGTILCRVPVARAFVSEFEADAHL